ncbi:MAG TPA: hypothetical protein VFX30_10030 [bacterium]|nr:hypothetical protein [bacterium]
MMRHIAFLATLIATSAAFLTGGTAGCGQNIPDVAGTYDLTLTECPGVFSETLDITQSGDVITFEQADLSGSIDVNGDFNVSNGDITCVGHFSDTTADATCTGDAIGSCDIVYEKR